jgi:SAM-dependent methyltransferase
MSDPPSARCGLCGADAVLRCPDHTGYQQPAAYQIYHCPGCLAAFARPGTVDGALYDRIYSQAARIPGYDRYLHYAERVLREPEALAWLAEEEDVYWAIRQVLGAPREGAEVLEVGCGFGYLTYALSQAGHRVTGIDISQVACARAAERYGPLYRCVDLEDLARDTPGRYDTVLFTEVLEHLPDPVAFVQAAARVAKPEGRLVLTTPNRTPYPADVLWETEPPPVHLWWFAEESIAHLAGLVGRRATFVDFREFTAREAAARGEVTEPYTAIRGFRPSRLPRLDAAGAVLAETGWVRPPDSSPRDPAPEAGWRTAARGMLAATGLLTPVRAVRERRDAAEKAQRRAALAAEVRRIGDPRRPTLCAVLSAES